jgi:hypothetical protein
MRSSNSLQFAFIVLKEMNVVLSFKKNVFENERNLIYSGVAFDLLKSSGTWASASGTSFDS